MAARLTRSLDKTDPAGGIGAHSGGGERQDGAVLALVRPQTLALAHPADFRPTKVTVTVACQVTPAALALVEGRAQIKLGDEAVVTEGEKTEVELA